MRRILLTLAAFVLASATVFARPDAWSAALKRGDVAEAATLLHRSVFEAPAGIRTADAAALKQLAQFYADGTGVAKDPVLACGLIRAHAIAVSRTPRVRAAETRAAQKLVETFCGALTPADRAAAFAAMTCPRIGLERHAPIELEKDWSIQFNDRSATILRDGRTREQALPGDLVCRAQVLLTRHSQIDPAGRAKPRHVIEQVTVQSAWRAGALTREIVWQLYEVRGLELDLAAVQRWEEPGSAWPAPPLPDAIARGVTFAAHGSDAIEYTIDDTPRRYGRIESRQRD